MYTIFYYQMALTGLLYFPLILLNEKHLEVLDLHMFCLNCKIYENMSKELALNIGHALMISLVVKQSRS